MKDIKEVCKKFYRSAKLEMKGDNLTNEISPTIYKKNEPKYKLKWEKAWKRIDKLRIETKKLRDEAVIEFENII